MSSNDMNNKTMDSKVGSNDNDPDVPSMKEESEEEASTTSESKVVSAKEAFDNEIENSCPITHVLMLNPVVAKDGITYEESAIKQHFEACKQSGQRIRSLFNSQGHRNENVCKSPGQTKH